jgi:hypothetical protein
MTINADCVRGDYCEDRGQAGGSTVPWHKPWNVETGVPAVQHCPRPTGPYRLRILPELPPLSLVLDQCRQRSGPLDPL